MAVTIMGSYLLNTPVGSLWVTVVEANNSHAGNKHSWAITSVSWQSPSDLEQRVLSADIKHLIAEAFTRFFDDCDDSLLRALPIQLSGTLFQQAVWQTCRQIPIGETRSYQQLGDLLGKPKAQQAVGQALKVNPVPMIVPCHRVVPASGKLGGYMGQLGSPIKQALLNHEKCLGQPSANAHNIADGNHVDTVSSALNLV